jgi:hypothetical protein
MTSFTTKFTCSRVFNPLGSIKYNFKQKAMDQYYIPSNCLDSSCRWFLDIAKLLGWCSFISPCTQPWILLRSVEVVALHLVTELYMASA